MVPPDTIFGELSTWVGVYLALIVSLGLSGYIFYIRVIRLLMLGKGENRFDHLWERLKSLTIVVLGQRRVLQSVSKRDRAGLGHVVIFWGFLSFFVSYLILIFGDAAWRPFSEKLLTSAGAKVFAIYLDIVAVAILSALSWAIIRRWLAKPHRLSFDLTRSFDAVVIVSLIGTLMISTILTETFHVARGGEGPAASAIVGGALGRWFADLGLGVDVANALQALFWWVHLLVILGFSIYIPFSKHMHMVGRSRQRLLPLPQTPRQVGAHRSGERGALWGGQNSGLHMEGAAGWVCVRCVWAVHRLLPR